MPYSTEYNEEKYAEIEKYLSQLEELDKEKVLSISTPSLEEAERLRWLIYDYLNLIDKKGLKIALFNNNLIVGLKKPTLFNLTTVTKNKNIAKELDSLIQQLIASPTPRKLIAFLAVDESISPTALSIVLAEYGRVMGE